MQYPGNSARVVLLHSPGGLRSRFGIDAPDRQAASCAPLCRQPGAAGPAGTRRDQSRSPACSHHDAQNGNRGPLPAPPPHYQTASGPLGVSVLAAQSKDHGAQPNMGHGYNLHSDEQGLFLPRGCIGLGDATCPGLAAVQQHDGRLLH